MDAVLSLTKEQEEQAKALVGKKVKLSEEERRLLNTYKAILRQKLKIKVRK